MNVPATNPESYWQKAVYLPLIDHLIQEMNGRLLSYLIRLVAVVVVVVVVKKKIAF